MKPFYVAVFFKHYLSLFLSTMCANFPVYLFFYLPIVATVKYLSLLLFLSCIINVCCVDYCVLKCKIKLVCKYVCLFAQLSTAEIILCGWFSVNLSVLFANKYCICIYTLLLVAVSSPSLYSCCCRVCVYVFSSSLFCATFSWRKKGMNKKSCLPPSSAAKEDTCFCCYYF